MTRLRTLATAVCAAVAVAVLLTACGAPARTAGAPAGGAERRWAQEFAPTSAWGRVTVPDADGHLSRTHALQAFTLAVGPVPGVPAPAGGKAPVFSADLAVDSVLADFAQLTPVQQRAVLRDLDSPERNSALPLPQPSPPPGPATQPVVQCPTADSPDAGSFRSQVAGLEAAIGSHLGPAFTIPVTVVLNQKQSASDSSLAYTEPCSVASDGSVARCAIHVEPALLSDGTLSAADRRAALAHELTHCYLYQVLGDAYSSTPGWYLEGVPTWVMATLVSDDLVGFVWHRYLSAPELELSTRAYTAVGFWAHLQESGTDVFSEILPVGRALVAGGDSTLAGWNAANPSSSFLATWGAGFAGGRYPGRPWVSEGAGLPPYQATFEVIGVPDGGTLDVDVNAFAAGFEQLEVTADVVQITVGASTQGMVSLGGGGARTLAPGSTTELCAKPGGCSCPAADTDATSGLASMDAGREYLGITGGSGTGSATVAGQSLATFCAKPCIVGTWTLTGATVNGQPSPAAPVGLVFSVGTATAPATFPFTIDASGTGGLLTGAASGTLTLGAGTMTGTLANNTLTVNVDGFSIAVDDVGGLGGSEPYVCTAQTLTLTPAGATSTYARDAT